MSLLRVLSVMVLLLFAAPLMDGVLTLFQNKSFDERTFFKTFVYAHPENPSEGDTHEYESEPLYKACLRGVVNCVTYALISVWMATRVVDPSPPPGGGDAITQWERRYLADRERIIVACQCGDGDDDGDNDDSDGDDDNDDDNDNDNDND